MKPPYLSELALYLAVGVLAFAVAYGVMLVIYKAVGL